jgi:POT family proton-dependent oligopeptide transporter
MQHSPFLYGYNLGAFCAPLVCGGFGDTGNVADFKWGFLAACIGMIISIFSFELLKNKLIIAPTGQGIGLAPKKKVLAESEAKVAKISLSQPIS